MTEPKEVYHINSDGKDVVIRHGHAEPIREGRPYDIHGDINTVFNYLSKKPGIDIQETTVYVERENLRMHCQSNERDHYQGRCVGQMEYSSEFLKLRINDMENEWENKELSKYFKLNIHLFENVSEARKLISSLRNIEVKVKQEWEKKDDKRGSISDSFVQNIVECNIPESFVIKVPVFKGQDKISLKVEVEIDPRSYNVILYSEDLVMYLEGVKTKEFDKYVNKIEETFPEVLIVER